LPRTQYYAAASLDGYIARLDGSIEWLQTYGADADLGAGPFQDGSYDEFYTRVGAIVMGSKTYEYLLHHAKQWPYEVPSFVLTSRDDLERMDAPDLRFVRGEIGEVHSEALAAAGDRNLWIMGGGNVAAQWIDEGLIDELIVTVVPAVLGEGIPLLTTGIPGELRLAGSKVHENGMVELRYQFP
jgi:dihydrofolate reductase